MNESDNPYVPPKAELADFSDSDVPASRPAAVNIALFLLGLDILLTLSSMFSSLQAETFEKHSAWPLVVGAGDVAMTAFLCVFIARGRNWARIVMLVLWLLGLAIYALSTYSLIRVMPASAAYLTSWPNLAFAAAPHLVMLTVSVLLFGPGREWFRRRTPLSTLPAISQGS